MSQNRENTVWQSADKTWNIGFYEYYSTGDDSEWDVEYTDKFNWVSTGHSNKDDAIHSWRGANPGSHAVVEYSPETASKVFALDDKAAQAYEASVAEPRSGYRETPTYYGRPKKRAALFIAKDLYAAKLDVAQYKLGGYANLPNARIASWEKELEERLADTSFPANARAPIEREKQVYINNIATLASKYGGSMAPSERRRIAEVLQDLEQEVKVLSEELRVVESASSTDSAPPRYHINPKTGRPNQCNASIRCPFATASEHYGSKSEARAAYEQKMSTAVHKSQRR